MPAEVRGWDKVTKWVEREGVLGNGLWGPWEMWAGEKEGCIWCSVAALGTSLGGWIWRGQGNNGVFS